MKIVAIFRTLSHEEIVALKNCDKEGTFVFYEHKNFLPPFFQEFKHEEIALQQEYASKLFHRCMREVADFGHQEIAGKKTVDWLTFGGSSFWYYIRFTLYFRYRYQLIEAEKTNLMLKMIREKGIEVSEMLIYTSSPHVALVLPEDLNVTIVLPKNALKKDYASLFNFGLIFLLRAMLSLFGLFKLFSKSGKYVMLANALSEQPLLSLREKKIVMGDQYIEYLLEHTADDKDFLFVNEVFPPSLVNRDPVKFKLKYAINKFGKRTFNYELFVLLGLLNPFNYFKVKKVKSQLTNFNNLAGKHITDWKGRLMLECLVSAKNMILFAYFKEICANIFLAMINCRAIITMDEHHMTNKSLLNAANKRGIKTFGFQHGVIHSLHMNYYYIEKDKAHTPWPDHTMVWGSQWKDFLVNESCYPADKVKVLGQLRTDAIPMLGNISKKNVNSVLENDKPLVMYASQPLQEGEGEARRQITVDFFKLCKRYPEYQFIIKPHPRETTFDFFHQIAKEAGTDNYLILVDDLYKLLAISDLVLVFHSTVGAEAVYFKKNLIVLNYFDNDNSGYISNHVAFDARNYGELEALLKEVIEGEKSIDATAQEKFIRERVDVIDGKVAERYVEFIKANS